MQWVTPASWECHVTQGLQGQALALWASHGRYWNAGRGCWEWQRPQIYGTCEDLFTQSIVTPYLLPMLERAGANVFVPRERSWQTEERVVDNDLAMSGYMERPGGEGWQDAPRPGFAIKDGYWRDGERPFARGTARMARATADGDVSRAYYRPNISVAGRYAVYVSYQTVNGSVDAAEYTVVHQGVATRFLVNQRMGSGTWVYLGEFDFDAGSTFSNYVVVSNRCQRPGFVTTDAVRFGGGMSDTERGGVTSRMPRAMECARYWTQYAGAPRSAVCSKGGHDDYGDDINARSLMSNWLSYGSRTNPATSGPESLDADTATLAERAERAYRDSMMLTAPDSAALERIDSVARSIRDSVARVPVSQYNVMRGVAMTGRVPLALQLGIHSDAGIASDPKAVYGPLTICTSDFNGGHLAAGSSRRSSFSLASELLYGAERDLRKHFPAWVVREIWDKNYSETRLPAQPSAIFETLSHENFTDMRYGHDPEFKFQLARSIYKTLLRFVARSEGRKAVVQPLAPRAFSVSRRRGNVFTLSWEAQPDVTEPTATPSSYIIYTRVGDKGYDNGVSVSSTQYTIALQPGKIYRFRVTAANAGGESFPTEELVALYTPGATETVMIVNCFHRLSGPAMIDNETSCGFDINEDIGLSYGKTPVWVGEQTVFDRSRAGHGLGHTDSKLLGRFTAGNDFNYAYAHAEAIAGAGRYNISSLSSEAFSATSLPDGVWLADLLLGAERDDGHSLKPYKTFTPQTRAAVDKYLSGGGRLLASGSYLASDMREEDEAAWLRRTLHTDYGGRDRDSLALRADSVNDVVFVGDAPVSVWRHVNAEHYAAVNADILLPSEGISAMPLATYRSGASACVATPRTVALGFPIECVKSPGDRLALMRRILDILHNQ